MTTKEMYGLRCQSYMQQLYPKRASIREHSMGGDVSYTQYEQVVIPGNPEAPETCPPYARRTETPEDVRPFLALGSSDRTG